jgi:fermentation-respiration switch protein FrsA (DUF1100 family)
LQKFKGMNYLKILALSLSLAYLGGILFAYFYAEKIMLPGNPKAYKSVAGAFFIETKLGNAVHACYWQAENDAVKNFLPKSSEGVFKGYSLLYNPGNTQDLSQIEPYARRFCAYGFDVLGYEYPGNGHSEGPGNEAKVYAAAEAAYDYLTQTLGKDPHKIILYGFSLGGGPAVHLAQKSPVAGAILECTFASAFRVKTHWKMLPWDAFDNLAKIKQIKAPLLLVHSLNDQVIDPIHSTWLAAAATAPCQTFWVPGAQHTNAGEVDPKGYDAAMRQFRKALGKY